MPRPRKADIDPDNPPLTARDFAQMRPAAEVLPPSVLAVMKGHRGPQKTPTKQAISLRIDRAVLERYKATGKGWQGRMQATLAAHAPKAGRRRRRAA